MACSPTHKVRTFCETFVIIRKIGQDLIPGDDFSSVGKQERQGTKQEGLLVVGNQRDKSLGDRKTGKLFKKTNEHKHLINDVPCPSCL